MQITDSHMAGLLFGRDYQLATADGDPYALGLMGEKGAVPAARREAP